MHKKILDRIVKTASTPKLGENPVAILIGGGTASGKTTVRKAIIEKELFARKIRAATVDPDNIKEYIPEYKSFKKKYPEHAASLVHKESCDIGALLVKQLMKNKKHLIYEGTMTKTKKYKWLINVLKTNGYEVHAYVVDVPIKVAKERAKIRAEITGRKVPHYVIENTHKLVPRTIEAIKDLLDSYRVYDNENGLTLIASNNYVESQKYSDFLNKGKIKYRMMTTTTEKRMMFDISTTHVQNMNGWLAEQKKENKVAFSYTDDCNADDILDCMRKVSLDGWILP